MYSRWSTLTLCGFLVLASPAYAASLVLVLKDGNRLEVDSYEVKGALVVLQTKDGKLQSLPLELVDLDATQRLELEGSETIRLRFDWPVGASAQVESRRTRERENAGQTRTTENAAEYRMTISSHPEGRFIRTDDFRLGELEAPSRDREDRPDRQALEQLSSVAPSYVVDGNGVFLRLEGTEELKAELTRFLEPLRSRADLTAEGRSLLDRLVSDEFLHAQSEQEWNMLVGTWVGADLEAGAVYESESEVPVPLVPGATLPMRNEFSANGPLPCRLDEATRRCVQLEARSYPDPEKMKAFVASLLQGLGGVSPEELSQISALEAETEIVVIAEPDTLIPYKLEVTRRIQAASTATDEPRTSQVDRRVTLFRWIR